MDSDALKSLICLAPASGVFSSDDHLDNRAGFTARVLTHWHNTSGHTIPEESEKHELITDDLYELYHAYRTNAQTLPQSALAQILETLNETGSIEQAFDKLYTALDS